MRNEAMVTGRMSKEKKDAGAQVLSRAGLSTSQAINRLFDLLIEEQNADFLGIPRKKPSEHDWRDAIGLVDSLVLPWSIDERFNEMSDAQIKSERLAKKGLV